jgi:hypothetical protein
LSKSVYKKAKTLYPITGRQINPIPAGTVFEVLTYSDKPIDEFGYSTCRNLGVDLIWNSEFKLLDDTPAPKMLKTLNS